MIRKARFPCCSADDLREEIEALEIDIAREGRMPLVDPARAAERKATRDQWMFDFVEQLREVEGCVA